MNKLYNDTAVQAIANAIRAKNGSSDTYTIAEMSTALNDISYYAKPTISNVPLATFEADGLPLNSLKVSVEAKQASGVPSPSNPLPISGWDAANVSDVGKNLVEETISTASVDASGKIIALNDYDIQIAKVKANETYTITSNELLVCGFYTTKPSIGSVSYNGTRLANQPKTFVAPIDGYIAFRTASAYATPQCELGSTATEYVPYVAPITTTISLGQTVYGGELDVVNGELRITWKGVDMGSLTWSYSAQNVRFSTSGLQSEIKSGSNQDEIMCSCYDHVVNANMSVYKSSNGLVFAKDSNYTDATAFKQSVTGQQFVYMLETPIIIPLTPTLIKSLNGQNNLSVDCGDIIELEYFKEV